ncbi:hypothetical protein HYN59_05875 [Flavobacterium album]|uniref:TolC family protein n=1 Tax=Flavobacterium album TaxID=2175091 RepID=A0A2S1QW92_9FLAO|nr:TolC family protein [Flavobacterium album]AWH84678.1 hypothetical protein HYN59_05875 [Flavobacterium album]
MKAIILYIAFFITSFTVSAQELWTLQRCLETGSVNNLSFRLRQLEILSAQTTARSAVMGFLPVVNATANHSYSIGSTIDPATNNRVSSTIQSDNFSVNAQMDIVNFNNFTEARRNKIAVLKATANKAATEAEYSLSILENYFTVLYTQELLKIQQGQFENAKYNLERLKKEAALGSKPQSDLYDMQVSYAQEENNILATTQLLYNQKLALLQFMNVTSTSPDAMVLEHVAMAETNTKPVADLYENALASYPKIKAAELNEAVAAKNVTIQKNGYLPVLSAFYSYSSFYYLPINQPGDVSVNPFWKQLADNKNHYVGLQLSVPLFNGLKTRRDVQLAKIERQKATVGVEQEKIALRQAIEQETAKQEQNIVLVNKLEETRKLAQKSFETTQAKFTNGIVEAIVFTSSKNQLLTTEYNLLKAKFTAQYLSLKLHFLETNGFP